jgi:hypothetical protein
VLEDYLIEYCAPTLASLKTANLFNCRFYSETELNRQLAVWNEALGQKGIALLTLHREEKKALIYVYRKSRLEADLNKEGVADFLTRFGYERRGSDSALDFLKKRIREEKNFPHEIGIFLGYPLGDVLGFIQNKGKNCKCAGCWKVYCDECEAKRMFEKFGKCKSVYRNLWSQGRSVWQLTVTA